MNRVASPLLIGSLLLMPALPGCSGKSPTPASDSKSAGIDGPGRTPERCLIALEEGNGRYAEGKRTFAHLDHLRVEETAREQKPFATVLACSDSRVPVEHLFDAGVGDIFVIRVAGNVCSHHEAGSIEYSLEHLGTPVLVILGHTNCGAVTAVATHAEAGGHVPDLTEHILPAYERAKADAKAEGKGERLDALIDETVRLNVAQAMGDLERLSPVVRRQVREGKLKVVGAVYDMKTGRVDWHPGRPGDRPATPGGGDRADGVEGTPAR